MLFGEIFVHCFEYYLEFHKDDVQLYATLCPGKTLEMREKRAVQRASVHPL